MKSKKKQIKYTDEPDDGLALPEDAHILTRAEEEAKGFESPEKLAGLEWERATSKSKVTLKPRRGGARPGAGRKAKGHVRMQVLVSKAARDKIRRLAKKRGVSMSSIVSDTFEKGMGRGKVSSETNLGFDSLSSKSATP